MVARGSATIESSLLENFDMIRGSFVETESPKVQKSSHLNQTLARLRRKTAKKNYLFGFINRNFFETPDRKNAKKIHLKNCGREAHGRTFFAFFLNRKKN